MKPALCTIQPWKSWYEQRYIHRLCRKSQGKSNLQIHCKV